MYTHVGRGGVRDQASFSGHTALRVGRHVPAVTVFLQNTLISTQMALPGTPSCQLAAPLTHWHPQLEFPPSAQLALALHFSTSRLPRLSLTPYFPSLKAGTDPGFFPFPDLRQVARTCLFSEDGRVEPGTSMELRMSPGWYWRGAASSG